MRSRPVVAGLAYAGLVFGAGFLLGTIRVLLLVPRLGERVAELLEMPVMAVVIVLAVRRVLRRLPVAPTRRARATMGGVALATMIGAELLLAVALQGVSVGAYLAGRDPVSGTVYLAVLVVFAALPTVLIGEGGDAARGA